MTLRTLKLFWWLPVLAVCMTVGLGLLYTYSQPNVYEAQATFILNPNVDSDQPRDLLNSINTLSSRSNIATTYCGLLESNAAFNRTLGTLNVVSAEGYEVSCSVQPDSNILLLRVRGESSPLARDIAYTLGTVQLDSNIGLLELFELTLVEETAATPERVAPSHDINIIVSIIVGLFGGILLLALLSALMQPTSDVERTASPL